MDHSRNSAFVLFVVGILIFGSAASAAFTWENVRTMGGNAQQIHYGERGCIEYTLNCLG